MQNQYLKVLVLLKFSSNTYLGYKSNDMYQQIWEHEGILIGKVVTSSWRA